MTKAEKIAQFDPNGVGVDNGAFIGLPFDEEESEVVILPIPWDVTASYTDGTSRGPRNILQASTQIDLQDTRYPDGWKRGIYMRSIPHEWQVRNAALRDKARRYIYFLEGNGNIDRSPNMKKALDHINTASDELRKWVRQETLQLLRKGKYIGLLGGEHSVPLGFLEALAEVHEGFGILQLDAHFDLRVAYEGFIHSHASIFHNALEIPAIKQLTAVGIRDFCQSEFDRAISDKRISPFFDRAMKREQFKGVAWHQLCKQIIDTLPEKVYVSFDIDALRPELCPGTGTPVPGGLWYEEAMYLLDELVDSGRRIIGFDLCEVAGAPHEWDGNVGARILYQLAMHCHA